MEIKEEEERVITHIKRKLASARKDVESSLVASISCHFSSYDCRLAKSERRDKDRDRIGYLTNQLDERGTLPWL